ncbi:MAG TPA: zinc-ribbon domain-containing protein [Solirubrobacteraceae bacterium]
MALRNPFLRPSSAPGESASVYQDAPGPSGQAAPEPSPIPPRRADQETVDLERLRDQLTARVAELQWDLGGLVYEMAIRDRIRVDILVRRAALLQDADAELGEVERILRMERTGAAGACPNCGAPHSSGAVFCWQCGQSLLEQVSGDSILAPR